MNAHYFKTQICDEFDGAKCYIKKAIEIKAMSEDWAKSFYEMAQAELSHATGLKKMFDEYYAIFVKNYKEIPEYIETINYEIADIYADKYAHIKGLMDAYSKL